jgi:inner membrane protein involved in colicin E2 resistance
MNAPVRILTIRRILTIGIMRHIPIHPVHFLFVAAGFFSFHLLLAYMAGIVNIHLAFVVSAATSVGLVTSHLRAAAGERFPWLLAAGGQVLYLVVFSYSFFLYGTTGLTVAVSSVATLAVLMHVTARVDWNRVFAAPAFEPPPLPVSASDSTAE